jgi:hypothetical protein
LQHAGTRLLDASDTPLACHWRPGPAADQPSRAVPGKFHIVDDDRGTGRPAEAAPRHPLRCPTLFGRASRGRPLRATRANPGPHVKGRRPAVYTSRCTALSVFRFPCSFSAPASSGVGHRDSAVRESSRPKVAPAVVGHVTHSLYKSHSVPPTPRRRCRRTRPPIGTRWLEKEWC